MHKPFQCDELLSCSIHELSKSEESQYLTWPEKLELTGVPDIYFQGDASGFKKNVYCNSHPENQEPILNKPNQHIPHTLKSSSAVGSDIKNSENKNYISSTREAAFEIGLKTVFDPTQKTCCEPSGLNVNDSTTNEACCTGKVFQNRCCLDDYTNVSVYLNQNISSEASNLPASAFDPESGFIKDQRVVEKLAMKKNLCCSGSTARGVAVSKFKIPGLSSSSVRVRRFVDSDHVSYSFNLAEILLISSCRE